MRILALDTATRHASVALSLEPGHLVELEREVTTHSEGLLALIDEALRSAGLPLGELDAIVCGRGPGSFTGLRIGMATAKGLCLATGKPLLCLSSLLPLALGAGAPQGRLVAAVLDARREEVYHGLFRDGALLGAEGVSRPEALALELAALGEPVLLAGDGALLYRERLQGERVSLAGEGCHQVRARHLVESARPRLLAGESDDLAAAVPKYIRASDARLPEPRRQS